MTSLAFGSRYIKPPSDPQGDRICPPVHLLLLANPTRSSDEDDKGLQIHLTDQ